jgi:hypothetical protein
MTLSRVTISRTILKLTPSKTVMVYVTFTETIQYDLFNSAKCHSAKCHSAKCHTAKCHFAKRHSANCHFANCHSANCHSAICHSANLHSSCHHSTIYHSGKCPYTKCCGPTKVQHVLTAFKHGACGLSTIGIISSSGFQC